MATRKTIVEATSQIIGQKEVSIIAEDRGPLDLTLLIEEKDKSITDLKKDNKLLADQVYELKKENADLKNKLDNR